MACALLQAAVMISLALLWPDSPCQACWSSFEEACRSHGDVEAACVVAVRILELAVASEPELVFCWRKGLAGRNEALA